MSRVLSLPLTALFAAIALPGVALAGSSANQASTIRIEPRPYYGASVTLEHGVRVWRPLPPTKYVVINPEGKTPLSLNLTDVQEHRTSTTNVYGTAGDTGYDSRGGTYGVPFNYGSGGRHHRMDGKHKHGVAGYQPGPRRPLVRHGKH